MTITESTVIDAAGSAAQLKWKILVFMKEILECEKVVSLINGCYLFNEAAEALWCFEKMHAQGKVVSMMG